jgi:predicted peroxiredoxin
MEVGRPLSEFMKDTMELGAKMYACPPAVQLHDIKPEDFIDGIESAGAASLLMEAKEADTVLTI